MSAYCFQRVVSRRDCALPWSDQTCLHARQSV